jgi:hypothetical protein
MSSEQHVWKRNLHPGDEITWNDPDAGRCSRRGIIQNIEYGEDDSAIITFTDGSVIGVFLKELS